MVVDNHRSSFFDALSTQKFKSILFTSHSSLQIGLMISNSTPSWPKFISSGPGSRMISWVPNLGACVYFPRHRYTEDGSDNQGRPCTCPPPMGKHHQYGEGYYATRAFMHIPRRRHRGSPAWLACLRGCTVELRTSSLPFHANRCRRHVLLPDIPVCLQTAVFWWERRRGHVKWSLTMQQRLFPKFLIQ